MTAKAPLDPPSDAGARPGPEKKPADSVKDGEATAYGASVMQCETTRLMSAVKNGDLEAFTHLERHVRGTAFQVAHSMVGSHEDALELCQETFLKVLRARATYDPAQPFLPWFQRILRNTCFSFLRKRGRLKESSLSAVHGEEDEGDWELVDPTPGPSMRIESSERATLFWSAFKQLGARDREILALRHFRELSYREIAEILAIPEGTVMSRLFHARRRLREALGPALGEILDETREEAPAQ